MNIICVLARPVLADRVYAGLDFYTCVSVS